MFAAIFTQFCWSTVVITLLFIYSFVSNIHWCISCSFVHASGQEVCSVGVIRMCKALVTTCRRGGALMSVFVNPSHDLKTFDSVCVHLSHDLHFWQCVHPPHDLHIWQCLCWSISWQYCYVLLFTVFVQTSHDLQTHLTNVFISWPADAFNSVCVLPSHDLQTLLTVFVFIHLMTCRQF